MADIPLPGTKPTGDDQQTWRELLEQTLPAIVAEIRALNNATGRN